MGRFLMADYDTLTKNQKAVIERQSKPREHWETWIGRKVNRGPRGIGSLPSKFKDGKRVSTISGVIVHPQMTEACDYTIMAFTFEEHDGYVVCHGVEEFDPMSERTTKWIRRELALLAGLG